MTSTQPDKFKLSLERLGLKSKQKIAIAISGGSDSTALCFLCKAAKLNVTGLIVDHNFRKESAREAQAVKKYIEAKIGIKCVILTNKKPIPDSSVEESLRDIRFSLLTEYCKANSIKTLLTAHHMDDQIETFLMRLERGSGLDGLTGIKESNKLNSVNIVRPLLDHTKHELKVLLVKNNLKWVEDPSNKNTRFTRNNIRATLENFSDYDLMRKRISGVMENLSRAKDFIDTEKEKARKKLVKTTKSGASFPLTGYKKLHPEIRLKILRELITEHSKTKKDVRMDSIRNLDTALFAKAFKASTLHGLNITQKPVGIISIQ